jgi:hypothetical protein
MDEITIAAYEDKLITVWDSVKKVWYLGLYPSCCCETPTETTTFTTETTTEITTLTTETTTEITTLTTETTAFTTETTTETTAFTTETTTETTAFTTETTPTETITETTNPTPSETVTDAPTTSYYYYTYSLSSGWIPVGDGTCVFSENPPGNIPIYLTERDCRCGGYGDC